MATQTDTDARPRPALQFRLRSLLVATACVAVCAGLLKWQPPIVAFGCLTLLGLVITARGFASRRSAQLVLGVALILGGLVGGVLFGVAACWVGYRTIVLSVAVIDANTGDPVPNAVVRLPERGANAPGVPTNSQGNARVTATFMTCGTDSAVSHSGSIELFSHEVIVSAQGYHPYQRNLADHLGTDGWDLDADLPAVTVELAPQ